MPKVSPDHLEARRAAILDGARRCFAEHGFEGATVRRLEDATELSRGAIFHHFRDKDALFLALADEDAQTMAATVAESGLVQVMRDIVADPGRFEWLATRLEIARRLRTDPEFREQWAARRREVEAALLRRIAEKKSIGRLRDDLPDAVHAAYLDIVFDGLVTHLATGGGAEVLPAVLDVVETSVRPPAGNV